ncbi:hypothetical protein JOB18_040523 [Solea senegalensis]|uniref:Uncharacterized protein n=1 Tax=Solea senegalensis TaxID=28829 RepID=A0AAV6RFL7_SOLSE|nr:CD99 antigen-like protein 2 [Solea senegalensis]KAG7503544.1 hypothetical protein JOB18_040523 [Solea senegalensis]
MEPEATEEAKTEPAAPADDITEPEATEEGKTEPAAPAEELSTTAAGDTEAAATTAEPAADPETEQPAVNVEEGTTADPDTTSAPVANGHDDVAKAGTDVADDKEEEPTEIANDTNSIPIDKEIIVPKGRTGVHAQFPTGNEEIAETEVNAAHVAGSSANDDQKTKEASSSSVAGVVCGIAVAAVGAVAGYFTYQKKKLCFKERQEADPEAARKADAAEAQSDPQVLSNLLNSS